MKKIIVLLAVTLAAISCERSNDTGSVGSCSYNGRTLHVGKKGGCYYINSSGNKEYVDKSHCRNCY